MVSASGGLGAVTNAIAASPWTLVGYRMMRWPAMLLVEAQDSSAERVV
jgi:hypothetical protein